MHGWDCQETINQTALNGYTEPTFARFLTINPFKLNGISQTYQLVQSISVLRAVGCYFSFLFKFNTTLFLEANSWDPEQTPLSAASDLDLHGLHMSHKKGRQAYMGEVSSCVLSHISIVVLLWDLKRLSLQL